MLEPVSNVSNVFYVDLENSNLEEVAKKLGLGLLKDEMENVKNYFSEEGRKPTDVELQAIDQAWSEHCCYKSSKPVLEETVFGLKSSKKVIAREDAGIMEFDDEHYYAVGLESHNHPSALDPYGGSATGIGGILREYHWNALVIRSYRTPPSKQNLFSRWTDGHHWLKYWFVSC